MRESNDQDGSKATNLCSLGVVDLDLSVSPDVFGLRAFDESLPITRMQMAQWAGLSHTAQWDQTE